jgi:formylglycine-generating enzyme
MTTTSTTHVTAARHGDVRVPGGAFRMGSDRFYPAEAPVRTAVVGDLRVDEHPVTNAAFRRYVKATGHITVAEQPPTRPPSPAPTPACRCPAR